MSGTRGSTKMGRFFEGGNLPYPPRKNISLPVFQGLQVEGKGRRIWKLSRDRSRLRSRNPGENLKCKKRKREVDASVGFPAVVATILGRLVDDPLHGWSSAIFQTRRFGGSPSSTTLTNSPRFPAPFYIGGRKECVSTDLSHLRFTLFSSNFPNSSIVESKSLHHFLAWS